MIRTHLAVKTHQNEVFFYFLTKYHAYAFSFSLVVHQSAKLQITKIRTNAKKKLECYLYKASWEFVFSYKLYLAKNF